MVFKDSVLQRELEMAHYAAPRASPSIGTLQLFGNDATERHSLGCRSDAVHSLFLSLLQRPHAETPKAQTPSHEPSAWTGFKSDIEITLRSGC